MKATMRYNYTPVRKTKMKNNDNTKFWQGCRKHECFIFCWWKGKIVHTFWKVWQFLKKWNTYLSYYLAFILLGIYSREMKTYIHTKNMYTIAHSSFIYSHQILESTKIPLKVMVKQCGASNHTMEYCLVIPRNEVSIHETAGRDLKGIMLGTKPISKHHKLYDSMCITFLEWWNYVNGEQISGCQSWRMVGGEAVKG